MGADPAELIFFNEMTVEKFFDEARRLGVPQESLQDDTSHNRVFLSCLVNLRSQTVKGVAVERGIAVTDEQARSIARNSLVPEVITEAVPLTPEERNIAAELYFHAIKAAAGRHGTPITDKAARAGARKMIATGERGLTMIHRIVRASGCLVVVAAMLGIGAAAGFFSAALVMWTG